MKGKKLKVIERLGIIIMEKRVIFSLFPIVIFRLIMNGKKFVVMGPLEIIIMEEGYILAHSQLFSD